MLDHRSLVRSLVRKFAGENFQKHIHFALYILQAVGPFMSDTELCAVQAGTQDKGARATRWTRFLFAQTYSLTGERICLGT